MKKVGAVCCVAIALCLTASLAGAQSGQPGAVELGAPGAQSLSPASGERGAADTPGAANYLALTAELKQLQAGLVAKEAELERLHHRWLVSKGRTPTAKEIQEFEAKRAKGKAKAEDNPYVNTSALSTPARWRAAYYDKLAEVTRNKERSASLERQIEDLKNRPK